MKKLIPIIAIITTSAQAEPISIYETNYWMPSQYDFGRLITEKPNYKNGFSIQGKQGCQIGEANTECKTYVMDKNNYYLSSTLINNIQLNNTDKGYYFTGGIQFNQLNEFKIFVPPGTTNINLSIGRGVLRKSSPFTEKQGVIFKLGSPVSSTSISDNMINEFNYYFTKEDNIDSCTNINSDSYKCQSLFSNYFVNRIGQYKEVYMRDISSTNTLSINTPYPKKEKGEWLYIKLINSGNALDTYYFDYFTQVEREFHKRFLNSNNFNTQGNPSDNQVSIDTNGLNVSSISTPIIANTIYATNNFADINNPPSIISLPLDYSGSSCTVLDQNGLYSNDLQILSQTPSTINLSVNDDIKTSFDLNGDIKTNITCGNQNIHYILTNIYKNNEIQVSNNKLTLKTKLPIYYDHDLYILAYIPNIGVFNQDKNGNWKDLSNLSAYKTSVKNNDSVEIGLGNGVTVDLLKKYKVELYVGYLPAGNLNTSLMSFLISNSGSFTKNGINPLWIFKK